MAWNEGYFIKKGNQISANDVDQEVYDANGNKVGFFSNGLIRGNNGNKLASCNDDLKIQPPVKSGIEFFLDMFKK